MINFYNNNFISLNSEMLDDKTNKIVDNYSPILSLLTIDTFRNHNLIPPLKEIILIYKNFENNESYKKLKYTNIDKNTTLRKIDRIKQIGELKKRFSADNNLNHYIEFENKNYNFKKEDSKFIFTYNNTIYSSDDYLFKINIDEANQYYTLIDEIKNGKIDMTSLINNNGEGGGQDANRAEKIQKRRQDEIVENPFVLLVLVVKRLFSCHIRKKINTRENSLGCTMHPIVLRRTMDISNAKSLLWMIII